MLNYALIVFAVAAVAGLYLAARHLRGNPPPIPLALLHGLVGAIGLVLLILAVVGADGGAGLVGVALILFLAAAIGGFVLFGMHLKGRKLGGGLIAVHALAAVTGFVLLLLAVLG